MLYWHCGFFLNYLSSFAYDFKLILMPNHFMRYIFRLLLGLFLIFSSNIKAQLSAGDIAFVGVQSDNFVAFAFMVINPIPPNTEIRFTDNGWSGTAFSINENVIRYTSPATTLTTGQVVKLLDTGAPAMSIVGGGSSIGKINVLSQVGDQILAYTGTNQAPNFIAGISTSNWIPTCDVTLSNPLVTCLPPPLVNGVNAIALSSTSSNQDNGYWNVPVFNGSPSALLAAINNVSNWETSESPNVAGYNLWPNWGQGGSVGVPSPIFFEQSTVEITEGAPTTNVKLKMQFPQATQQTVTLSLNLFAGTTLSDFVTNPILDNNQIQLDIPQNTTEVSFQIQAFIDGLVESTEQLSFNISSVSSGLEIGTPNTVGISILNVDNSNTTVNFLTDTLVITEGQLTTSQVLLAVLPTIAQSGTVVIGVQNGTSVTNFDFFTQPAIQGNAVTINVPISADQIQYAIAPFNDTEIEQDEYVTFTILSVSTGFNIGQFNQMIVKIVDNDTPAPIVIPSLVINEINASNVSFGSDENGEFDDWIELFNQEDYDVNIASFYISNDVNNAQKFRFPTAFGAITVPAQGYKLIWCDNFTAQGPTHANFTLANNGGFTRLTFSDGISVMDSVSFPAMSQFQSFARVPNGSGSFKLVFSPSPAIANVDTIPDSLDIGFIKLSNLDELLIFPNPAQNFVDIQSKIGNIQSISVVDMQGRIVKTESSNGLKQEVYRLQTEMLSNGFYTVIIRMSDGSSLMSKLVIQH